MNDDRLRLFVALELPDPVRDALTRWGAHVRNEGPGKLRPVAAEALHVTLCFLGWHREEELEGIAAACGIVAAQPASSLVVGEGLWLPRRRPRVLAVELEDPERGLTRVQSRLSDALHAGGWYEPETRPYLAHVTVGRVGAGTGSRFPDLPEAPHVEFTGSRVVLYRSRLSRSGARYEALAGVELSSAGG